MDSDKKLDLYTELLSLFSNLGILLHINSHLTGSRGYQVVGASNELMIIVLLINNTAVFEVAGLMLAPIALGALLKVKFYD